MDGITFDTGALTALERRRPRIAKVFRRAVERRQRIVVPSAVVVEWWRARSDFRESILASVDVEVLDDELARVAGAALAAVEGATAVDAVVMASAARRGGVVYTSDFDDLSRLRSHFAGVRVLSV